MSLRLVGSLCKFRPSWEVSMATLWAVEPPLWSHQLAILSYWKEFGGTYSPWPRTYQWPQSERVGRGGSWNLQRFAKVKGKQEVLWRSVEKPWWEATTPATTSHTSGKTHWQHWHGIYFSEIAFSHIEVPRVKGLFVAFSFCLHSWQQGFYNSCEWHRSKFLTKQKSLYYSTLLDRGKRC